MSYFPGQTNEYRLSIENQNHSKGRGQFNPNHNQPDILNFSPTLRAAAGKPTSPSVENVTKHLGNMRISLITSAVTTALAKKLREEGIFTSVFIPDKSAPNLWKVSPTEFHWEWENPGYVKLPLSSLCRSNTGGAGVSVPRWEVVEEKLLQLKKSCQPGGRNIVEQFKETVGSYDDNSSEDCNFKILSRRELSEQLIRVLPVIIDCALELPSRLGSPIPYLRKGQWHTLFLTRGLCSSLLANAFLSTIPHDVRNPKELPHFHFLRLFHEGPEGSSRFNVKVEKIKCILEYFEKMRNADKREKDSIISFERRCIPQRRNWANSRMQLCFVTLNNTETIEDAQGLLQADFANKYVGGGILSEGMVQEEIRFAISPELIVSRLFTQVLGDDEVLVVTGAKQFSSYSGYRSSFEFKRMEKAQQLEKDEFGRELVQVVAMDALNFKPGSEWTQFQLRNIDRELHKSYVAFVPSRGSHQQFVATGNWGCGAFNGDPQLKFITQWMAASEGGRVGIKFYTVGNSQQEEEIKAFYRHMTQRPVSVGEMYKILGKYENEENRKSSLFDFVKQHLKV